MSIRAAYWLEAEKAAISNARDQVELPHRTEVAAAIR